MQTDRHKNMNQIIILQACGGLVEVTIVTVMKCHLTLETDAPTCLLILHRLKHACVAGITPAFHNADTDSPDD